MTIYDPILRDDRSKKKILPPPRPAHSNQKTHDLTPPPTIIVPPQSQRSQDDKPKRRLNLRGWLMILAGAGIVAQFTLPYSQKPITIISGLLIEPQKNPTLLQALGAELVKTRETLHQKTVEYNDLKAKCQFAIFISNETYQFCLGAVGMNYQSQISQLHGRVKSLEDEIRQLGG